MTNTRISPMDVLILAEVSRMESAVASLELAFPALSPDKADNVSQWQFLSSLAELGARADRLERTLDALEHSGYSNPATSRASRYSGRSAARRFTLA